MRGSSSIVHVNTFCQMHHLTQKMQFYCCSLNTAFEWKNMELSCTSKCMSNHFCALLIFSSERFASLFVICFASQLSCVVVLTLPTKHHKKCQSVATFCQTFSKITLLSLTLSFFQNVNIASKIPSSFKKAREIVQILKQSTSTSTTF